MSEPIQTYYPGPMVTHLPPGKTQAAFTPGDFFLVCDWNEDYLGRLIRAGERVRFGNVDATRWSHSGMIVASDGTIVEANAGGVQKKNIDEYTDADLYVVNPSNVTVVQRANAVNAALSFVGDGYGIIDFISLAFQSLFNLKLLVLWGDQMICSGLVARCTEKYIDVYPRKTDDMMPADLAYYWKVESGQVLPKFNWFDKLLNVVAGITHIFSRQKNDKPS